MPKNGKLDHAGDKSTASQEEVAKQSPDRGELSAHTIRRTAAFVFCIFLVTLIASALAFVLWGIDAAKAVLTLVGSLGGLVPSLVKLLELLLSTRIVGKAPIRRNAGIWLGVIGGTCLGVFVGYSVLPETVSALAKPFVSVVVSSTVDARPPIEVLWRNFRHSEIGVVIRPVSEETIYFPQPGCISAAGRVGSMRCRVEVGGIGDSGEEFDIIVLGGSRHGMQAMIEKSEKNEGFVQGLVPPEGLLVLTEERVRRRVQETTQ